MPAVLIDTKLYVPRLRDDLVPRPRLDDRLRRRDDTRLTLVSAPAGFGKTTLLTGWLAATVESGRRIAWVSLDASDSRATSFWTYVLTALERAAPGTGTAALALLDRGQAPIEAVLASALNELSVLPDDLDLVLDDYHLADGPEIQPGMVFLLEHLPPQVHLVISTRADPVLPLARLRARGQLTEVRAADLRFTSAEAAAYLNESGGLGLEAADIAALEERTEGWIAALQLAALSLRDRSDVAGFIGDFTGNDRYVVDYLVEEVLGRQPEDVRRFLLDTSILHELTASLCEAVTGAPGGRATLESLDRQNLFVVPLDDHRRWYRYHHLFADVLRAHLLEERPREVPELHRRASRWYEEAGQPVPAVTHALAADDVDRAAELMERSMPALQRSRQEDVILSWADALPAAVVRRRPVLAIGLVGGLMSSNQFGGVEERLHDIERALGSPDDLVVVDHEGAVRIPAAIEMYRAALALTNGDLPGTIAHADVAASLAAGDDLTAAAASALSGLASWAGGDLVAAHRGYTSAIRGLERAGHISDVLGCSITVADLEITRGHLAAAEDTFERALELAKRESGPVRGTADMLVGLSQLALEHNDLTTAAALLQRSEELGDQAGLPQNPYRSRVAMAALREAAGDLDGALDLLDDAAGVYVGDYSPDVRPVAATRARLLAIRGDVSGALAWVRERKLTTSDDLDYLREFEHITLVRVLLAQHRIERSGPPLHDAAQLLDRLLDAAQDGDRTGTVIEILALQSLVLDAAGDGRRALMSLERALSLAEPERYARVFLREPAHLDALLKAITRRRPDWPYPQRLLEPRTAPAAPPAQALIDPLSERELDVLRLLASDLSGPAIARELVVSLNTVRTHTKHIYTKLDVNNRRAAVSRARRLGMLSGHVGT